MKFREALKNSKHLVPKYKLKGAHERHFIAVDTENDTATGYKGLKCMGFYGTLKDRKGRVKTFERLCHSYEEVGAAIKFLEVGDFNTELVFYNLAYDEAFLHGYVDDSKTLRVESRVIYMETYGGLPIWDIQNVSGIEYSLENWIEKLRMTEKYGIIKESLDDLDKRVMSDAKATWYLTVFMNDFFTKELKSQMRYTIASSALEYYQRRFCTKPYIREFNEELDTFERESYRGGRVEVFKRGIRNIRSFDVASMYLSILRDNAFPNPSTFVIIDNPDSLTKTWRYYYDNYLCLLDVTVYVPFQIIAPLPMRLTDKEEKTVYPTGSFRGVYTSVELQTAEKYGAVIVKVHKMTYYRQKEKMFEKFALSVWQQRRLYKYKCMKMVYAKCANCDYKGKESKCKDYEENTKQNEPMEVMIKKIGNGLTGKFGQINAENAYYGKLEDLTADKRTELFGNKIWCLKEVDATCPYGLTDKGCQYKGTDTSELDCPDFVLNDKEKEIAAKELDGQLYISFSGDRFRDSPHSFTVISSFITSYARIKILTQMKEGNNEKYVCYCDTDCIKFIDTPEITIESRNDLGYFNFEYAKTLQLYAPKNYDDKCKGVPKNKYQSICPYGQIIVSTKEILKKPRVKILKFDRVNGCAVYQYESPVKFRSALRRKNLVAAQWIELEKVVDLTDNKRAWYGAIFCNQGIESIPLQVLNNRIVYAG
jgi:hypothetical protein